MRSATFSCSSKFSSAFAKAAWPRLWKRRYGRIDHLEADAGIRSDPEVGGEELHHQGDHRTQSPSAFELASARAIRGVESAARFATDQRVDVILDAHERRRVDGFALENSLNKLAAMGQTEKFWQRPGRRVVLNPFRGTRGSGRVPARPRRQAPSARRRRRHRALTDPDFQAKAAEVASQIVRPLRPARSNRHRGRARRTSFHSRRRRCHCRNRRGRESRDLAIVRHERPGVLEISNARRYR